MHHKYVVRDAASVWTGSTNWTADSWTREENVIVTVDSPTVAARYRDDFEQLWTTRIVAHSGKVDTAPVEGGIARLVLPGPRREARAPDREGDRLGPAPRPDRLAGDQLGADPRDARAGRVRRQGRPRRRRRRHADRRGARSSGTRTGTRSGRRRSCGRSLTRAPFSGKVTTPYAPGSVHDYMHAKVTVADDTAFVGSFNLSHSGELNAENVLELQDPQLADRLAAFVDEVRGRYPPIAV